MTVLVSAVIAVAMLGIVPLGLTLIDGLSGWPRPWLVAAATGTASLLLPRGVPAAGLAAVYALATAALAGQALRRLVAHRSTGAREVAVLTALITPLVAAVALVAERGAHELFGFELDVLLRTVAHFHVAGFAAALVAGLTCRAAHDAPLARAAALTVPGGTALVLVGFFVGDVLELVGAAVLTAGMWMVGWTTWRDVRSWTSDRPTQVMLIVSATVLVVTMLLALSWAVGEVTGWPHPSLTWMAATHGVGNALGFGLCGVLAWRRLHVPAL